MPTHDGKGSADGWILPIPTSSFTLPAPEQPQPVVDCLCLHLFSLLIIILTLFHLFNLHWVYFVVLILDWVGLG